MSDLYEGQTIKIKGVEYIIPPLDIAGMKRLKPVFPVLDKPESTNLDRFDAMIQIIGEAMRRNYPETTNEALETMIDLGNVATIFNAVMAASGMVQKGEPKPGENV